MAFVALLDANVLYPAYLRDALLRLAEAEVYQVRWSRQILDEMARNVLKNNPDLPEESMERLMGTMERAQQHHRPAGRQPDRARRARHGLRMVPVGRGGGGHRRNDRDPGYGGRRAAQAG